MKKRGLILFPHPATDDNNAYAQWREAAHAVGAEVETAFFGDALPPADFAMVRGYDAALSERLEREGCKVFNRAEAMGLSRDKRLTYRRLRECGVSTPECVWDVPYEAAAAALGVPFVTKAACGSCGRNVFLTRDAEEYACAVHACGAEGAMSQRYVAASHGRDLRVWTVGDRAVACVMRRSDGALQSNYAMGGHACAHPLDEAAAQLAVAAAQSIGLDFAGVDLLMDGEGGYTVCEVNGNAGFRTLYAVQPDNDLLKQLMEWILKKL